MAQLIETCTAKWIPFKLKAAIRPKTIEFDFSLLYQDGVRHICSNIVHYDIRTSGDEL